MTARVNIALAGRDYDVAIGSGLVDDAVSWIGPVLRRPTVAIVMDQTIADLHGPRLIGALEAGGVSSHSIILPPGEATKSFTHLAELCDSLLALELDRGDMIIAFGGGVIGDLTGFAAAIYKRGIDFIQIPTTLLAQVDSSVGGKTAIDTSRGKNLIGAFHQPRLVLADLSMLDTLSARELRCGYGEVLKYGLLGDRGFFHWLEDHGAAVLDREPEALARAVRRSVEMKADIVAADEREGGARALLNLGHTFAHAIETLTGFGETLKHGEAVGLGCAMAFRFSAQLGFCQSQEADRVARAVAVAGLPSRLADVTAKPFCADSLMAAMAHDKKTKAGRLTFILARAIGEAFIADDVEGAAVRSFLLTEGATP